MPVSIFEVARCLALPDDMDAWVDGVTDIIQIRKNYKVVGTISRKEIDDDTVDKKIAEILRDVEEFSSEPIDNGSTGPDPQGP
jgi:hypothetical protein